MKTSFSELSDDARIWIFPSSRKFYPQELDELDKNLGDFLDHWPTSNHYYSSYQLLYKRFIIIGIDEQAQSLDLKDHNALTTFIQKLETAFNVVLMDRINITYKQGEYVQYKDLGAFKKLVKNRSISKNTVVFDNLINTKEALKYNWEIPISESWLNRFFPK